MGQLTLRGLSIGAIRFWRLLVLGGVTFLLASPAEALPITPGGVIAIDPTTESIVQINLVTGAKTIVASGGLLTQPLGLTMDSEGNLFVGEQDRIIKIARNGTHSVFVDNITIGAVTRLDTDASGNVYANGFVSGSADAFAQSYASDGSLRWETLLPPGDALATETDISVSSEGMVAVAAEESVGNVFDADDGSFVDTFGVFTSSTGDLAITFADDDSLIIASFLDRSVFDTDPFTPCDGGGTSDIEAVYESTIGGSASPRVIAPGCNPDPGIFDPAKPFEFELVAIDNGPGSTLFVADSDSINVIDLRNGAMLSSTALDFVPRDIASTPAIPEPRAVLTFAIGSLVVGLAAARVRKRP